MKEILESIALLILIFGLLYYFYLEYKLEHKK